MSTCIVAAIFFSYSEGGGHWGVLETAKPKKKSSKTAKPPKNSLKTDTAITSEAYRVNYNNTNFIKVFVKSWTCIKLSEAFASFAIF